MKALLVAGLIIALSAEQLLPQALGVLIAMIAAMNITEDEMRTEK